VVETILKPGKMTSIGDIWEGLWNESPPLMAFMAFGKRSDMIF
jgi:hypothetical protein